MEAEQKATELINSYYGYGSVTQLDAIEEAQRSVLTGLCKRIDDTNSQVVIGNDYDIRLVKPLIQDLKNWQEVAAALQEARNKIPVN